jgi:hypothetical protein
MNAKFVEFSQQLLWLDVVVLWCGLSLQLAGLSQLLLLDVEGDGDDPVAGGLRLAQLEPEP